MSKRYVSFSLAVVIALLFTIIAAVQVYGSPTSQPAAQTWEYLYFSVTTNEGRWRFSPLAGSVEESRRLDEILTPIEEQTLDLTFGETTTTIADTTAFVAALNFLGSEGWELISSQQSIADDLELTFVFKRPVVEG